MNKYVTHGITFVIGVAVGGAAGYFATKKYLANVVEETITQEVEDFKADYTARREKTGPHATPGLSYEALNGMDSDDLAAGRDFIQDMINQREIVQQQGYESQSPITVNGKPLSEYEDEEDDEDATDEESHESNLFDRPEPEVDESQRVDVEDLSFYQDRDHTKPFVISHVEFAEEEDDFDKITLTWYAGDDTLADDDRRTIDNIEQVIGFDALGRFGDHSADDDIVYVRNVNYGTDYEVVRTPEGYFSDAFDTSTEATES